jgi:hypothetical protein
MEKVGRESEGGKVKEREGGWEGERKGGREGEGSIIPH